jgi:hypothetical protein
MRCLAILVGATGALGGCFDEPDYAGLACSVDAPCPAGFVCNDAMVCQRPGTVEEDAAVEDGATPSECETPSDCLSPAACEVVDDRVACVEGICRYPAKVCDEPPPGECIEGDTKYRSFSGVGQCDAKTGACVYAEVVVDCLDCQVACLLRCEGLMCNESNGGCRLEGHCLPETPPACDYVIAPDSTPCDRGGVGGAGVDGFCLEGACVACFEDEHCDDADACTLDGCVVETSSCAHAPIELSCDVAPGQCYEAPGACDPFDGSCVFDTKAPGTACDDENLCTVNDACMDGDCLGGSQLDCDDDNECTDDSCDPATGCANADNTSGCDDGDACTAGDACSGGACAPGPAIDCSDGNPCTTDGCDPASGCTHADQPDGTSCTFAGGMTGMCSQGACVGCTLDSHCDDGNECTDETCTAGTCTYVDNTDPCSDGDACTYGDACSRGICSGTAITCSSNACITRTCNGTPTCSETIHSGRACGDDGNACTTDVCNANGACTHPARGNGTSCGANAANRCCDGTCVNISTNEANCGGCNTACDPGFNCESVATTNTCSQSPANVSGRCRCNGSNAQCPRNQVCRTVSPYANRCAPAAASNCAAGESLVNLSGCPNYCRY